MQDSEDENISEKNISNTNGLKENEILSMTNKIQQYNCQLCDFKTDYDDIFNQHILIHKQKLLKCKKCPYSTHIWDSYKFHQQIHDEPGLYSCPHCDFTSNFMIHLKQHKCSKVMHEKPLLSQPSSRNCNSPLKQVSKGYTCTDCDFQTQVKGIMKLHTLLHSSQLFLCSQCPFKTTFDTLLALHEQTHTNEKSTHSYAIKNSDSHCEQNSSESHLIKGPTSDLCLINPSLSSESYGSKDSDSTLSLPQGPEYLQDLDSIKDFSSYSCQKKFQHKKKYILRSSNESHSFSEEGKNSKIKYNCPFCDYVSSVPCSLKQHLYTHDFNNDHPTLPNQNYTCPFCSCEIGSLGKLKRHFLIAHLYDTPKSKEPINNKPSRKKKKNLKTKYMAWPVEEKKEVYWCHLYSKHDYFERVGMCDRRRNMLLKRGILDTWKVNKTGDTRFQNIVANMKMGRTKVTREELEEIEKDVDQYMKTHWQHDKKLLHTND